MTETQQSSRGERLKEELVKYGLIAAYLWVCFAVLALYKAASLEGQGVHWVPLGFAVVQALVLGKFILIGDALKVGHRSASHPLLHRVAWRTVAMLALLVVFKVIEEVIVALVHGQPLSALVQEIVERPLWVTLAPVLLMLLVLVPMMTAVEIHRTVGPERFRSLLLGR